MKDEIEQIKKLEKQIEAIKKQLTGVQEQLREHEERADSLSFEAYVLKSTEAVSEREESKGIQADLIDSQSELKSALREAESRLKVAKAEQAATELEAKMTELSELTAAWISKSQTVERTVNILAKQIADYQEARAKVFAASLPISGRQLGLEKKSTVANYIHLRLSRLLPLDFLWISEKLSSGLYVMDSAIAEALIGKADTAALRGLEALESDLIDKLTDRDKVAV